MEHFIIWTIQSIFLLGALTYGVMAIHTTPIQNEELEK